MRFDELASRAGQAAARVGGGAERPTFGHVAQRQHRRALVAGWSTAAAALAVTLAVVMLWPGPHVEPSPAAGVTTTTTVSGFVGGDREACPVTVPDEASFSPESERPAGPRLTYDAFWYGTPELWTMVHFEGEVWSNLPVAADGTLTQKTFWWTEDYVSISEPEPAILVTSESLNSAGEIVEAAPVTNGGHPELGVFVIAGLQIPHEGCWRVTAEYGNTSLDYVAWVGNE